MDYLDALSRFVHDTTLADLDARVVASAKDVILDTIGAMLAGSRLPENGRLARLAAERSGRRPATLLGHRDGAEPMLAALANATAGVALEVDEGNRLGGGHPAIHVLPALLAVAEETGADGRRLLECLVVGYEVTSRLGGATVARANVHSHGTWGTPGAAAAVAKLLGQDAGAIRRIISLAASMSPANSWTPCFEGATIRNLYPGRSAFQGILAVHLDQCGFTGLTDGPGDIYGTILAERFEPDAVVAGLGAEYRIAQNYFKLHACCRFNHPALDAVQRLRAAEGFGPDDVARITVTSIPFAERMTECAPPNALAAKFSLPYAVAAAIALGRTDVAAFADSVIDTPTIRKLAATVEVRADPRMSMRRSDYPTAIVRVVLRDGRELSESTGTPRGDAAYPVPRTELIDKFVALAAPVLGDSRAAAVVDGTERLNWLPDIRELTALLQAAA
jgi:2-methylcitrate dehydratase PrpD